MGKHSVDVTPRHRASKPEGRNRNPFIRPVAAVALLGLGIFTGQALNAIDGDSNVAVAKATQQQGLNLNEVCSAINADTIDRFRNSGIIEVEVPPEFDNNSTIAAVARGQLECSGETVSGAEANRRICNNLTVQAVRELANKLGVEQAETAKIVQANVDQARAVFNCAPATDAPSTQEPTTGTDVVDGGGATDTPDEDANEVPGDPDYVPEGQKFNDVDPEKVNK